MIFVYILIPILLICFLFWARVHIIFDYHDAPKVTIRYLFLRFDGKKLFERFKQRGKTKKKEPLEKKEREKKKRPLDLLGFADFLVHITNVIRLALKEHFAKSRVYLKELRVKIGTEDAAQTAMLCGAAMQAANGLCAVLQHVSHFRCDNRNLEIAPDFCDETSSASLHLVMSSRVIHILGVLIRTYFRFFEGKENEHA